MTCVWDGRNMCVSFKEILWWLKKVERRLLSPPFGGDIVQNPSPLPLSPQNFQQHSVSQLLPSCNLAKKIAQRAKPEMMDVYILCIEHITSFFYLVALIS